MTHTTHTNNHPHIQGMTKGEFHYKTYSEYYETKQPPSSSSSSSSSILKTIQRKITRICRPRITRHENNSIDSLAYAQSDDSYAESLDSENVAWGKVPKQSKKKCRQSTKRSTEKDPSSPDSTQAMCRLWL
ncbi:hypothetical protein PNOK_0156600 [Pyrrhoderma noxium]|uniref:Uncharacterized protein n=1 Tax=Pyrrhoderma noxium TaxID=2282107 RepID=A0A286UPZ5_9AGAM|nr:hypothetical protein PNOK_0156600 [Pyrrhoderma noxium]